MLLGEFRNQKNSAAALTTGTVGLMAGSFLLFASVLSAYRLNQPQNITINPSAWSWMGGIHLQLDPGVAPYGPTLSEASVPPQPAFVGPIAPPASKLAKHSIKVHRALTTRRYLRSRIMAHTQRIAHPFRKRSIRVAQAAHPIQPFKAVIASKHSIVMASGRAARPIPAQGAAARMQASPKELATFQYMRRVLRSHFLLAMTTRPAMVRTVIAQLGPTSKPAGQELGRGPTGYGKGDVSIQARRRSVRHHRRGPAPVLEAKQSHRPIKRPSTPVIAHVIAPHKEAHLPRNVVAIHRVKHLDMETQDVVVSSQAATSLPRVDLDRPDAQNIVPRTSRGLLSTGDIAAAPSEYSPLDSNAVTTGSSESQIHAEAAPAQNGIKIATANRTKWLPATAPMTFAAPSSGGKNDYSSTDSKVSSQAPAQTERTDDANSATNDYSIAATCNDSPLKGVVTTQASASLTEAFEWVTPVGGGNVRRLTRESGPNNAGWVLAKAPEHWPTLARLGDDAIPMISNNTEKLLSALGASPVESEAGILFGKVPAGWSVRVSGRADSPVILNTENQTVSPGNTDGERYFAFLNVAPGAHLLYLINSAGLEEGAVGLPLMGGVATYADLTHVRRTTFTGKVMDGSDSIIKPMQGVTVRVLGSADAETETDSNGNFKIKRVLTVADFPVYAETDIPSGHTHRYQLSPDRLHGTTLYRLNEAALNTWLDQLEGTISPDSGLVIAAFPHLISKRAKDTGMMPGVHSLSACPTLAPEVYTLSADGQMQVEVPMKAETNRFVSVQVPEGPAITYLTDKKHDLIWSDLIMVSPAVVNLIGPN